MADISIYLLGGAGILLAAALWLTNRQAGNLFMNQYDRVENSVDKTVCLGGRITGIEEMIGHLGNSMQSLTQEQNHLRIKQDSTGQNAPLGSRLDGRISELERDVDALKADVWPMI